MRYAITDVEAEMQNIHSDAREVIFDMTIPKEAFVSNFSMVIDGTTYQATVKTKDAAKTIFANSGVTSGLIENDGGLHDVAKKQSDPDEQVNTFECYKKNKQC